MTPAELRAARALLLALHEQADHNPRMRPRIGAFRTALACIEAVQAASEPVRVARRITLRREVQPTVHMDCRPTCYGPPNAVHRTELMTELLP
jgi:hypothetical protein